MSNWRRILVVIAGHTHYGREALQGMYDHVRSGAPWDLHYENTSSFSSAALRLVIQSWGADGIFAQVVDRAAWRLIARAGIPAVNVSGCHREGLVNVRPDNEAVGRLGCGHLLACGLRSLAFCGEAGEDYSRDREGGFNGAARQAGLEPARFEIHSSARWDWHREHKQMATWLRRLPKPVGIMACNDYIGRVVMWTCHRVGLRVPDDVALVGVDNDPLEAALCRVPLSSVELPARVIGERAAQALDRMLDSGGGAAAAADATVAPVGVVPRASSRAYPTTDSALAPALRHIREQLAQPLAVPDLARRCDLSLRWFGVRFRRAVGRTPAAEIARLRLELAKSLLADTDTKITRIHAECGFTRYSYFARVFRQTTGFTPLMFRRRFQRSSAKGDSPVAADG